MGDLSQSDTTSESSSLHTAFNVSLWVFVISQQMPSLQ